jgi:hypothetical protein
VGFASAHRPTHGDLGRGDARGVRKVPGGVFSCHARKAAEFSGLACDQRREVAQIHGDDGLAGAGPPRKARAAGIHLVFAAQRPEASVMPMQLRANLGNRLILRVNSERTSELSLGDKGAERLLGRGHLLARLEGGPSLVYAQVPLASSEEIETMVSMIARDPTAS